MALIAAAERLLGAPAAAVAAAVHLARDLEARLMGLPTGIQDHYPALLGGALEIRHQPGGEVVRRLDVDLEELGRCLVVAYSGGSHLPAANNFEVVARRLRGDRATRGSPWRHRRRGGRDGGKPRRRRSGAGRRRDDGEWAARRELAPVVSTPAVERILEAASAAGAWGGKVCGAGGGGCVAILAPPAARAAVAGAVAALGHPVLDCRPTATGMRLS